MPDDSLAATFEARLDKLAALAVRVGLNLRPGQELVMTAPVEALPLVRRIATHAYQAGATLVTPLIGDDEVALARYRHAAPEAFDTAPGWLFQGMAEAFRGGAARLAVVGESPTLLAQQDPEKVARANRARSIAYRPALELITSFAINWNLVPAATPGWAKEVFPGLPEAEAVARLWDAIFAACRVDVADPVAEWAAHNARLHARTTYLNDKDFLELRYRGPGTDLVIGLADGHLWAGGAEPAKNGIVCNPNIPTEEVFTTPHRLRVDGTVRSTKPLAYQGTLIEDIRVTFAEGRIVEANAAKGAEVLRKVLETDEGAARLGEVALVPHSSPISASGLLFRNTLFDENAASHIALGQAYTTCLRDSAGVPMERLAERGANASLIHIDWMIGSGALDIDGVTKDGAVEPLMRGGEFVGV
ncbi:aminopeptidase [Falsiroseomonas selenitidurans]|uniref:Aminopeptidase n=1 Tax=Falsiroseomonas selenitidurans TaxID=2716335 RepID=A0ABX1EAS2_9PROT|nr:aminopeptidase [Falsiroseomonas selenitidurans]NKC33945.1 aminopeptidase [Falsiroseomonas selenitidurans]